MATPHGKLVKVAGKNMHIRQMGCGEKMVVILPGLNDPLPTVEYAPLMRELSKKHTVCIVELFGYGHSDGTDTPRTNENYVNEIREGLAQAGIAPPYVLMPYSASGIYAEYYAAKYSEEVAGLILLDSTPTIEATAQMFAYTPEDIEEIQSASESEETTEDVEYDEDIIEQAIAEYIRHGYTLEELEEIEETPNHEYTIMSQDIALSQNIFEVMNMPISKEIPILLFSSAPEDLNEEDMALVAEFEAQRKAHITRLGNHAKLVIIKGSTHADIAYHRDYRNIISQEIDAFLGSL